MQLVLIPGDGIGPEVTEATRRVVAATGTRIDWVEAPAGIDAAQKFGDPLPVPGRPQGAVYHPGRPGVPVH
jgi:isocitrate dehydrogenase (NAD+)